MLKKQTMLLLVFVSVLTLGLTGSARALEQTDTANRTTTDEDRSVSSDEQESEEHEDMNRREHRTMEQEERVAKRKAALTERFQTMKTERKERLAGKRLELCEARQTRINTHLDRSVERGENKLQVFQNIEKYVKEFYVKKELSSDQYESAVAKVDEKRAAVLAAMAALSEQEFVCQNVDGARPDGVVREAFQARRTAMGEYRSALKELIQLVRQALEASEAAREGSEQ